MRPSCSAFTKLVSIAPPFYVSPSSVKSFAVPGFNHFSIPCRKLVFQYNQVAVSHEGLRLALHLHFSLEIERWRDRDKEKKGRRDEGKEKGGKELSSSFFYNLPTATRHEPRACSRYMLASAQRTSGRAGVADVGWQHLGFPPLGRAQRSKADFLLLFFFLPSFAESTFERPSSNSLRITLILRSSFVQRSR